jgi:hypothetical protein
MNTELKIISQNKIGIDIGIEAEESIITIWGNIYREDEEYQNLAKLIIDSNSTFQSCGLLPSELLKQRDEMRELLKYLKLKGGLGYDIHERIDKILESTEVKH